MSDSKTPEQIMREQVAARVAEERGELPSGSAQGGSDLPGGEHSSPPHGTCPPGREAAQGSPASTEDCAPKLPEASNDFVERCLDANELGDGMLFAYLFQNRHAYVGQADEWLYFWGHHWHVDLVDKAHRAAMDVEHVAVCYGRTAMHYRKLAADARAQGDKEAAGRLDSKAEKLKARAHKLRSQSGRMRCLDFAKTNLEAPLAIRGDEIDCDPWALPVANGVIDLKTGGLRDGRPSDYMMKSSPVRWEGIDAPCPTWEQFIYEVMGDDREMSTFLQRLFGYGITGLSTEHVFVVFFGRGRNGKGIMTEVIQEVLGGRDATAALAGPIQSEMLMDQGKRNAAGPSPDIMALRGLRMAFASETDEGQKFSSARVKWLSGGETLTGRYPHDKRNVSFQPTHLLCLLTNHKPHASSNDFAFWERLLLVDFPLSFVDREPKKSNERPMDKGLKEKLRAELPGILAWLVRGCLEWQRLGGLKPPPRVREATAEYRREEDLMADFVDDCCIEAPPDLTDQVRIRAGDLFEAFCLWYRVNITANPKKQMSQKRFGLLIQDKFERERKGGIYYYYGVELNDDAMASLRSDESDRSDRKGGDK